jgi:alpha-L-fucosidase
MYQPTRDSVATHPIPDWYHNAKLGIFIHWGLYSVPAFAPNSGELSEILASGEWARWFANNPYAEWYMNSYQIPDSPTYEHHRREYGGGFTYADFASHFNEAITGWDPDAWAALFQQVGARYVVLTTKHHDGFLLWPSRHPNPFQPNYHATRDLPGDLAAAVRARGMQMGFYYSGGLDWTFNPKVIQDIADIPAGVPQMPEYVEYANNHWRELIDRYETVVLWNDIAYPAATDLNVLFAEFYNKIPHGVINNRFTQKFELREGHIASDNHFDFETPEYMSFSEIRPKKWESCRGIGASFGYNRMEGPEQYQSVPALVRLLVDIVSKNGNLLLNIGPMADGTIPPLQHERLVGLGDWLRINGAAIFETRPWTVAEGQSDAGVDVRFTQRDNTLYATLLDTPTATTLELTGLSAAPESQVQLLGHAHPLVWTQRDTGLVITLPGDLPAAPAHAVSITPQPRWVG